MNIREELTEFLRNFAGMLRWLIVSGVTGVVVGMVAILFGKGMTFVTGLRGEYPWILYFLPVGGAVIIGLYHLFKVYNPRGTNLVLSAIHSREDVPLYMAPLIIVSTWITHLVGGSAGREGAALQLGGSIGEQIGRWLHFDERDKGVMVMCGMSAAFSALFGTPLAAAIFPMEVVSVGIMHYAALIPCVCASVIAGQLALHFGMQPESFPVTEIPAFTVKSAGGVLILAILCAAVSIVFCILLHQTGALFHKFSNPYIKAVVGGLILLGITLLLGTQDYTGAGIGLIERAFEGDVRPEAFLLKMILTAITLGCGFKGGEIVPSFCVGATFGALLGQIMGLPTDLCGAVGMAAVFCGVTNCPISTMLISFEMFGFDGMLYYVTAVAVSYMLSGYYGLYHDQKIMYSKIRTEFINRRTK